MNNQTRPTGRERIAAAFAQAHTSQLSALMPYYTLGYPDPATSLAVVQAIAPHANLLELGIPFSDPIADGPTIQRSTQQALEQGMSTQKCLEMVQTLRQQGIDTPVMLMGYYNPMLAYGLEKFVAAAASAGADGFIVPDLPPEEAAELEALAQQHGLVLVHFLAPTSNSGRIESVTQRAQGFIYMVSLTGITGARAQIAADLEAFIGRVRSQTQTPLAVGFGISTPEQAHQVGELADGVIVGSALINAVDKVPPAEAPQAAAHFIQTLQKALQKG